MATTPRSLWFIEFQFDIFSEVIDKCLMEDSTERVHVMHLNGNAFGRIVKYHCFAAVKENAHEECNRAAHQQGPCDHAEDLIVFGYHQYAKSAKPQKRT